MSDLTPGIFPMVSVIVPVYNVENYLSECIDSIISQTYQNIEIILVDDGSTDSSGVICDSYKSKDDRIIVIHKQNGGLSDARNVGLDIANGEYIAFVDSDDYLSKCYIEVFIDALVHGNCDVVAMIGDCEFWESSDKQGDRPKLALSKADCNISYYPTRSVLEEMLYQNIATGAPYTVCKRYIFDKLRFPVGYYYEDVATTYKEFLISLKSDHNSRSAIIDGDLYAYRKRTDSIIRQGFNEKN